MKDDDQIHPTPNANEPLEEYFRSPRYLQAFKRITFSTFEEQEEANRIFSLSLTHIQRMEYMLYLNRIFFAEQMANAPNRFKSKVYFD